MAAFQTLKTWSLAVLLIFWWSRVYCVSVDRAYQHLTKKISTSCQWCFRLINRSNGWIYVIALFGCIKKKDSAIKINSYKSSFIFLQSGFLSLSTH